MKPADAMTSRISSGDFCKPVFGPLCFPGKVAGSQGNERHLTTANRPPGLSTAATACANGVLSGTPGKVFAISIKSTFSRSRFGRSQASPQTKPNAVAAACFKFGFGVFEHGGINIHTINFAADDLRDGGGEIAIGTAQVYDQHA